MNSRADDFNNLKIWAIDRTCNQKNSKLSFQWESPFKCSNAYNLVFILALVLTFKMTKYVTDGKRRLFKYTVWAEGSVGSDLIVEELLSLSIALDKWVMNAPAKLRWSVLHLNWTNSPLVCIASQLNAGPFAKSFALRVNATQRKRTQTKRSIAKFDDPA